MTSSTDRTSIRCWRSGASSKTTSDWWHSTFKQTRKRTSWTRPVVLKAGCLFGLFQTMDVAAMKVEYDCDSRCFCRKENQSGRERIATYHMFDGGNITRIKRPFWKTLQQVRNIRNKPWGEQRMVYLKGMKEQKQKRRAIDRFFNLYYGKSTSAESVNRISF